MYDFWRVLETVPYLTPEEIVPVSGLIIALEIFTPIGLMFRSTRSAALGTLILLFSSFMAYAIWRITHGYLGSCGCFSGLLNMTSVEDAGLDAFLIALCAWLLRTGRTSPHPSKRASVGHPSTQSGMVSKEGLFLAGCLVVAVATVFATRKSAPTQPQPALTNIKAADLEAGALSSDAQGDKSPVLVMFGDYQCPPCRQSHKEIDALMSRNPGGFRLCFRNLPLSQLHAYAAEAAIAAEAAREQGKFWSVHRLLFAADFKPGTVDEIVAQAKLDKKAFKRSIESSAKATVKRDEDFAHSLGLHSTPSLFLCMSDGRVFKLDSVRQIEPMLKAL